MRLLGDGEICRLRHCLHRYHLALVKSLFAEDLLSGVRRRHHGSARLEASSIL